jgi:hypothetical protein
VLRPFLRKLMGESSNRCHQIQYLPILFWNSEENSNMLA